MTIRLREFTLADYDAVSAIWQSAGPGLGLARSDSRAEIAKKLQRDPDLFLVAQDGSRLLGTVIGGYDGRRGVHANHSIPFFWRRFARVSGIFLR